MTKNQVLALKTGDKVVLKSGVILTYQWRAKDSHRQRWAVVADGSIGDRHYLWHTDLEVAPKKPIGGCK